MEQSHRFVVLRSVIGRSINFSRCSNRGFFKIINLHGFKFIAIVLEPNRRQNYKEFSIPAIAKNISKEKTEKLDFGIFFRRQKVLVYRPFDNLDSEHSRLIRGQ